MAPGFKLDGGMGNSIDEDDFFGRDAVLGSSDNPSARTEDETNIIRDGNDVILKQFELKMIKREYSRNQTSRGNKVSASGAMTLAGVDWSGFPGAAHGSPNGESTPSERKTPRERRRKSLHASPSDDEEIIGVHQRRHHRYDANESRLAISQRRLSADGAPRAASADSALSPRHNSPMCRNRRISNRNILSQPSGVGAVARPASSRSSRRMSLDLGGSHGNSSVGIGGSGIGSGSGSGHRMLRNRKAPSGERSERQQRPKSEKNLSSDRPQRQHSAGIASKRATRPSNRTVRSESPSTTRQRKSTSPHTSKRGLAAASATTLDTRRKSKSHSRSRRGLTVENSKGDFRGSELKKQSSIRW